mgnify:CR=1 FL=1
MGGQGAGVLIMTAETPVYLDHNATTPIHPEVVDATAWADKVLVF